MKRDYLYWLCNFAVAVFLLVLFAYTGTRHREMIARKESHGNAKQMDCQELGKTVVHDHRRIACD